MSASATDRAQRPRVRDDARPRVCVLHVGGTIGMVRTERGYMPMPGFLAAYLQGMPELARPEVPAHELVVLEPLLDSSDMSPADWLRIAAAIAERERDYDGFVVLHGTDTMAYTASALSFLLRGLSRPVILTGSQLSLEHVRSDGRAHIITAIILAGTCAIPEVSIYFGARLLRGNRAQKVQSEDFLAFDSGNLPPLARVGVEIDVARHLVRPAGAGVEGPLALSHEPHVAALRVFPGMRAKSLSHVLAPPTRALVLETYGAGNFPSARVELLDAVREATGRGGRQLLPVPRRQRAPAPVQHGPRPGPRGRDQRARHDPGGRLDQALLAARAGPGPRGGPPARGRGPGRRADARPVIGDGPP